MMPAASDLREDDWFLSEVGRPGARPDLPADDGAIAWRPADSSEHETATTVKNELAGAWFDQCDHVASVQARGAGEVLITDANGQVAARGTATGTAFMTMLFHDGTQASATLSDDGLLLTWSNGAMWSRHSRAICGSWLEPSGQLVNIVSALTTRPLGPEQEVLVVNHRGEIVARGATSGWPIGDTLDARFRSGVRTSARTSEDGRSLRWHNGGIWKRCDCIVDGYSDAESASATPTTRNTRHPRSDLSTVPSTVPAPMPAEMLDAGAPLDTRNVRHGSFALVSGAVGDGRANSGAVSDGRAKTTVWSPNASSQPHNQRQAPKHHDLADYDLATFCCGSKKAKVGDVELNQGEVKWLVLMLAALLLGLLLIWLGVAHKSWNRWQLEESMVSSHKMLKAKYSGSVMDIIPDVLDENHCQMRCNSIESCNSWQYLSCTSMGRKQHDCVLKDKHIAESTTAEKCSISGKMYRAAGVGSNGADDGTQDSTTDVTTIDSTVDAAEIGVLGGTIVDAIGADPIANVLLELLNGPSPVRGVRTDAHGTFEMTAPEGTYLLSAYKVGHIHEVGHVQIEAGQNTTEELIMSPSLTSGQLRAVLSWSAESELDLHLKCLTPTKNDGIGSEPGSTDGLCIASSSQHCIDYKTRTVAEVQSAGLPGGPQTMTIMKPSEGEYTIFVSVDTTDVALDWSELNAMITFYVNDTDRYYFSIGSNGYINSTVAPQTPTSQPSVSWVVFRLKWKDGRPIVTTWEWSSSAKAGAAATPAQAKGLSSVQQQPAARTKGTTGTDATTKVRGTTVAGGTTADVATDTNGTNVAANTTVAAAEGT